jgi:hypothetical protein
MGFSSGGDETSKKNEAAPYAENCSGAGAQVTNWDGWDISQLGSTGCPCENCTVFHDLGKEFILGNIGEVSWKK